MKPCLFNVENLTAKGKNCLESPIPALLCAAACGIALYEVDLAKLGILFGAIGELSGECRAFKNALPRGLTRLSCRLTRLFGGDGLHYDLLGF